MVKAECHVLGHGYNLRALLLQPLFALLEVVSLVVFLFLAWALVEWWSLGIRRLKKNRKIR